MLTAALDVTAQDYISVDIGLEGEPLDLISFEDNKCHLVTNTGLYDISNITPEPIAKFLDSEILRPNQNYSSSDLNHYYPLPHGGYLNLRKKTALTKINTGDLETGVIFRTRNGSRWLINNFLYKEKNKKWLFAKDLEIYSKFTDAQVYRDKAYLTNYGEGVIMFDDNMEMSQIKKDQGLASNYCNSICVKSENEFYVGHKGAMSCSKGGKVEKIDLREHIGDVPILEFELDRMNKLWGLTSNKVFKYIDGRCVVLDINLKSGEVLKAMHICKNQDVWILSDRCLYIFPNTNICSYVFNKDLKSDKPLQLYQIRNNTYYSDGHRVASYDDTSNKWINSSKKKAPQNVIRDEYGNTNLLFSNNKGIRLSKASARKLNNINVPENEVLNNISRVSGKKYYATQNSIFQVSRHNYKLISHREDNYYKVINNGASTFAFASKGISKIQDGKMVPLLASYNNHRYKEFYNQMSIGNKLITITDHSLHLIDTEKESLDVIDLNPLKILDLQENGLLVWVLCTKSVMALNKSKLANGQLEIVKTIPIYENFEQARLSKFTEDELWVSTANKILRINIEQPTTPYSPNFAVHKIVSATGKTLFLDRSDKLTVSHQDLPIEIMYSGANFWSDNIKYAYHVNHEGKNISEWKSENSYTLRASEPGRYSINAKFKDDIYGLNIDAPTIMIELENGPVTQAGHSKFLLLPLLLISLIILALMKGISKIT